MSSFSDKDTAGNKIDQYLSDAGIDDLTEMVLALSAEVCILRDRIDTHERLADLGKPLTLENTEDFEPDQEVMAFRSEQRQKVIAKVLRVFRENITRDIEAHKN